MRNRTLRWVAPLALVAALTASATSGASASTRRLSARGPNPPATADGVWLAGDLHVHTPYSHDSYGGPTDDNTGPEEAYLLGNTVSGNFQAAAARGLDFLAITDHNDIRSQTDPGFGTAGVTPIHAYENSLDGHAQMLGATRIYDRGDQSAAAVTRMADALRADGGVFQINHPALGSTDYPNDLDWGYRYDVVPDTVEVWNIARLYQPPFPSASSNDDAIRYWEGWLDRGYRIGATGGSDSHYLWSSLSLLGSPSTWVFTRTNSEDAILDGLRHGRTFVSWQPPALNGPRLFLEADGDGDGTFESLVGDEVPPGSRLRVRVEGAAGSLLRLITNGGREAFEPVPVTSPAFEHVFTLPESSTWVRAEIFDPDLAQERKTACDGAFGDGTTYCRNGLAILALTSPLYLARPAEPVATVLNYVGETRPRGDHIDAAARLTERDGTPVAGRPVTFSAGGIYVDATTSQDGLARATLVVQDHGRSVVVESRFAGDDVYAGAADADVATWGGGR